ncbi:MAG: hypothetical protein LBG14_05865, partial [Treponema sp.]|nr:hypothetical protein [Treponema sp.]
MKKIFLKTLYLGIVLCIAGLSGCQNPLNPPKEAPAPQGTGRVVVTIVDAAANGSARTIAPDAGGFAKYTLTFSGLEDEPPRPPADITMGGSVTGTLPVGPWTITATGYIEVEGSYVASAEGSAEVDVVSGQSVPLTIILGPKTGGGQGTFAYSLKIPSGLTGSDLIIRSAEGGAVAAIPLAHDPEGITGSVELNPGQYLALIRLQKGEGGAALYAGLTEALHIYSGLISALPPQEFTDADFTAAVSDFDLTSLVPAPVVWSDPVAALSGNQYTGTIAWTESDDTPVAGIFEPGTAYKAVVTLTAGSNYTLTGVPADSFAHSGATTITNTANSGVITIIFPATDESSITGVTVSPASSSVAKGSTGVLTAAVTATGTAPPPQTVVWTVEGNNDSATTIFLSPSPGFGPAQVANLTIATNETASTLTVKATSTVDDSQYGTATVTVTAA